MRALEEAFAGHREEFGRAVRAVGVERRRFAGRDLLVQQRIGRAHHRRPARDARGTPHRRRAVGLAVLLVELVREFVDDHVVTVVRVGRAGQYRVPGQHHLTARRRFAQMHPRAEVLDAAGVGFASLHRERAGIEQDFAHVGEVVQRPVQHQQTGLGGDQHLHVLAHHQAIAADEALLGDEDADAAAQPSLQVRRQASPGRHPSLQQPAPFRRKGLVRQPATAQRGAQRCGDKPQRG